MGYLESYHARKKRNHEFFKELAFIYKTKGFRVLGTNQKNERYLEFIKIFDDKKNKAVIVGWSEVPYRFYVGSAYKESQTWGDNYPSNLTPKELIQEIELFNYSNIISSMEHTTELHPNYLYEINS